MTVLHGNDRSFSGLVLAISAGTLRFATYHTQYSEHQQYCYVEVVSTTPAYAACNAAYTVCCSLAGHTSLRLVGQCARHH